MLAPTFTVHGGVTANVNRPDSELDDLRDLWLAVWGFVPRLLAPTKPCRVDGTEAAGLSPLPRFPPCPVLAETSAPCQDSGGQAVDLDSATTDPGGAKTAGSAREARARDLRGRARTQKAVQVGVPSAYPLRWSRGL